VETPRHHSNGQLSDVQLRKADGIEMLPAKDQKEAMKVVERYADEIAQKWLDFFVLKKNRPFVRSPKDYENIICDECRACRRTSFEN
jgi:hypothetical protein